MLREFEEPKNNSIIKKIAAILREIAAIFLSTYYSLFSINTPIIYNKSVDSYISAIITNYLPSPTDKPACRSPPYQLQNLK